MSNQREQVDLYLSTPAGREITIRVVGDDLGAFDMLTKDESLTAVRRMLSYSTAQRMCGPTQAVKVRRRKVVER